MTTVDDEQRIGDAILASMTTREASDIHTARPGSGACWPQRNFAMSAQSMRPELSMAAQLFIVPD